MFGSDMKTIHFFLVFCVILKNINGNPQVLYKLFSGNADSSARQYYANEYQGSLPLSYQPELPDYNLNHGEVDGPNDDDDDDVDGTMENFFYNNGFIEISNQEPTDSSVMPYEETLDTSTKINKTDSLEESSTEEPISEEEIDSSIEFGTNDNNQTISSETDVSDKFISTFVHPLYRPSNEWSLEVEEEMESSKPTIANDENPMENPEEAEEAEKPMNNPLRIQKPQKKHRKRIRFVKKKKGNFNRLRIGTNFRSNDVREPNGFARRGNLNSASSSCKTCKCGVTTARRTEDGEVAAVNELPWLALITYNDTIQCGGTLINDRHVLTSAHCVRGFDINLFQLRFLEYNIEKSIDIVSVLRRVARIYSLDSYVAKTSENDIAVLQLTSPINFETSTVRPICLPPKKINFTRKTGIIAGWETITDDGNPSNIVRKTEVPIISNQQCLLVGMKITSNMLCAGRLLDGGVEYCHGESGGPLMIIKNKRYHLAGVISWGDGCARPNKTGIYTRVTKYLPWINKLSTGSCECT